MITLGPSGPAIQEFPWKDSLFCVCWSEINENIIVCGGGDGSIILYDTNNPRVSTKSPSVSADSHV